METTIGAELAAREDVTYDCPNGHVITMPFSVEADIPGVWDCHCGAVALVRHGDVPEFKQQRHVRTHWDMLRERRSIPELQELLEERLVLLRAGRVGA
jgi:hypothetical protein